MATTTSLLHTLPEHGVSLDELASRANAILSERDLQPEDGRAAPRVDSRTIRFYQTLGVLPKPAYEGRRALYSLTHLLRLVAAKQLQAEGYSLAQIQSSLPARSDRQLLKAILDSAHDARDRAVREPALLPPRSPCPTTPTQLRAFELAKGVTLLVDPSASPDPDQLAAILAAAIAGHSQ